MINGIAELIAAGDHFDPDEFVSAKNAFAYAAEGTELDGCADLAVINTVGSHSSVNGVVTTAGNKGIIAGHPFETIAAAVSFDEIAKSAADDVFKLLDSKRQRKRPGASRHHNRARRQVGGGSRCRTYCAAVVDRIANQAAADDGFNAGQLISAQNTLFQNTFGPQADNAAQGVVVCCVGTQSSEDLIVATRTKKDVVIVVASEDVFSCITRRIDCLTTNQRNLFDTET